MTCKTLDFTPWYELQADSESDDEHGSGSGITVKDLGFSHYYSASGRDYGSAFSEQLDGETKWYTLHREPISSSFKGGGRRGLTEIQHLLEEMDDAAKKINKCNSEKSTFSTQRGLASSESDTSDGGMSLQEFPIDMSSKPSEVDGSGHDEVVSSAIAEISKEFTTGNLSTGPLVSGDSDESRISSDNEVRRRLGAAYAHYQETATGFSDSDWNPYVTESDTNASPRCAAEFPSAASLSGATDSKISSSVSSFNPPFSSTKAGSSVNRTNGGSIACSKNSYANTLHLDDIREQSEGSFHTSKFDGTVSSQPLSRSKLSEYSISRQSVHTEDPVSTSTFLEDYAHGFQTCIETTSLPTVSGDARKKMQTSLVQVNNSSRKQEQELIKPKLERAQNAPRSDFEKGSLEKKLQSLQQFEDLPQSSFTGHLDSRRSLPGKGYFLSEVQKALLDPQKEKQLKAFSELCSFDQARWDTLQRSMLSVPAGGLQKKTAQTEVTAGLQTSTSKSNTTITGTQARESGSCLKSDVRLSTSSTTSLAMPKKSEIPLKEQEQSDLPAGRIKPDELNQQVQKLLLETACLTGSSRAKVGSSKQQSTSLDYKQLHLDLQEIQDSLKMMGQHSAVSPRANITKTDGENEFEIVPSTTTTPERGRQLVWDYGADLGYGQAELVQMEDMMSDITSACSPTDTGYSGGDRVQYTSDGEETRTSGSSLKDHVEDEEQQENIKVSAAQTHQTNTANSVTLDDLISDFRRSQAVENGYQALCSLEVTKTAAREVDLVRKRLDLSSLSDSFSTGVTQNTGTGLKPDLEKFSAINCAQILISNQMKKMADRTFEHSIELHTPVRQVLECYPVYTSQHDQPQHQQLQQELQLHLQQQQASVPLPPPPPPPPPPLLSLPATQQRAGKVGQAEETERTEIVQQRLRDQSSAMQDAMDCNEELQTEEITIRHKAVEVKGQDDKEEARDQQEDSQSTVTSPADSDRSCELRKGKYRPYRPTGSQDTYYTESDTASVADSATTAESTHTSSDDALGPHFPSSVLGSRKDISGSTTAGIYSKHGKVSTAMGSSVLGPYLPTIQERATPDRLAKEASDIAQSKLKNGTPDGNTAVDDSANTAVDKKSANITGMLAKQQAHVEDILRQRDAARHIPGQQSVPPVPNDELAEHTNMKEVHGDPRSVKSSTVNRTEVPHAVASTSTSYSSQQKFGDENSDDCSEVHRELLGSCGSSHRSKIPVHGPAHDDHVDDRSYSNVRKAVLHDNFRRVFDREQSEDGAYMRLTDSGEARHLRLFDANAKTDITHQRKQLSSDNISSSSQSLADLKSQKHQDKMHYIPENKMFEDRSSNSSSREILQQRQEASKAKSDSSDRYVTRDLAVEGAVGKKADKNIARGSEQSQLDSHIPEQDLHGHHILQGSVTAEGCGEANGQRGEVEDVQRLERKHDLKENSMDETGRSRGVAQQSLQQQKEIRKQQNEVQMERKVETREEVIQLAVLRRGQELRKTAWMTEKEDAEKQAQKTEELLKREVEVMRQFHRRRIQEKETENQQEVEEMVEGGLRHVHTDADRELLQEGRMLLHGKETEELIDRAPISRRAQLLREALEQEEAYQGHPDLQALWECFVSTSTAGSDFESSYDSVQLQGLAELLQNPTQHLVHRFLQQRHLLREEDYQRAEAQRELYQKEMKIQQTVRQRLEEESAAMKREHLRQEARRRQQRLSSEEESNGSYGEMLQEREQERLKRREVRTLKKKQSSLASPSPHKTVSVKKGRSLADSCNGCAGETAETLYSIPEDTTHDSSPLKNRSPTRSRNSGIQRKRDVIDPNMSRLRERIIKQREKIEQEQRREARRDQKLQKLKALLEAKRTGLMDDSTVSAHLATISSTSAGSSFDSAAQDSRAKLTPSEESTTTKDSSAEMQQTKVTHARHVPISFKRQPVASKPVYGKDLLGFEESTLLWDSSSSQTDIDSSCPDELLGILRKDKRPRVLSKYGSKHMKPHQMYSPYMRQKEPELTSYMAIGARCWSTSPERKCCCKTKDAGTMYPTPGNSAASYQVKHHGGRYVSQGAQTSPDIVTGERQQFKSRSPSPSHDPQPVIRAPLTKKKNGVQVIARNQLLSSASREQATSAQPRPGKRPFSWQGRSISPAFDSSSVAACLSSERERPRSSSPPRTRNRTCRSPSPVELRLQSWTNGDNPRTHYQQILRTKQQAPSPARSPGSMSPQRGRQGQRIGRSEEIKSSPKNDFSLEFKENHLPPKHQHKFSGLSAIPGGLAWFIPVTESRPWRMPFKERQAYALRQENWPQNLLHKNRNTFVNGEFFGENLDCYGGNTAKFYLDKTSKKMEEEIGRQYDMFDQKPLCRMSLQEALMSRKPEFVSALRQRQKRLNLAAEHRRLQALVRAEQEMIFLNHRKTVANPEAHPYSENLHQPKKRVFTKQEMREQTEKKYQHLPEVKAKELERRRNDEYKLNRLRAKVYNKRIQRKVLDKMRLRTCS